MPWLQYAGQIPAIPLILVCLLSSRPVIICALTYFKISACRSSGSFSNVRYWFTRIREMPGFAVNWLWVIPSDWMMRWYSSARSIGLTYSFSCFCLASFRFEILLILSNSKEYEKFLQLPCTGSQLKTRIHPTPNGFGGQAFFGL